MQSAGGLELHLKLFPESFLRAEGRGTGSSIYDAKETAKKNSVRVEKNDWMHQNSA